MIYLGMVLVFPAMWYGFWWLLVPIGLVLGWFSKSGGKSFGLGAGLVWAGAAYLRDGMNAHDAIAPRMAGMFSLPNAFCFYLVLILIGYVTGWLWFRAGREVRVLINR